jgi:hypothetical protein
MSGSIDLVGPSTTPGAPVLTPAAINAAVNPALAATLAAANLVTATETARATAAEGVLTTAVGTETTARTTAVTAETTRATGAEGTNATAIAAEITRALAAEALLAPLAAHAGAFTTLSVSGLISPTQTVGIQGTTTNNNAQAGSVGEFISATVTSGAAVALTTGVLASVTTISLTAGDWDVRGTVGFQLGTSTSITAMLGGVSSTGSLPNPASGGVFAQYQAAVAPGSVNPAYSTGPTRISLAATTTVSLLAQAIFTVAGLAAFGFIGARRVR